MPRKARIDAPGALHHIIVRGIERRRIFDDDHDRYDFLTRLGTVLEETKTGCYAWALVPNHFHLLLRTGADPVATVMRRLLTGHAVGYNRRHRRHGHLFQNRYKSILCQDDPYFLELVRYIHLNPLRAGLVKSLAALDNYAFSGHAAIMARHPQRWQDSKQVLGYFSKRILTARSQYRSFIAKGVDQGRRKDLTGGGLIRSAGGWLAVSTLRKAKVHVKSDERILGDGEFVAQVLAQADEALERRYALEAEGMDIGYIAKRVAKLLDMRAEDIFNRGRYKRLVTARSLLCFWAVRELNFSMASLARKFGISTVAVSKSVRRGAEIVKTEGYKLISFRASTSPF